MPARRALRHQRDLRRSDGDRRRHDESSDDDSARQASARPCGECRRDAALRRAQRIARRAARRRREDAPAARPQRRRHRRRRLAGRQDCSRCCRAAPIPSRWPSAPTDSRSTSPTKMRRGRASSTSRRARLLKTFKTGAEPEGVSRRAGERARVGHVGRRRGGLRHRPEDASNAAVRQGWTASAVSRVSAGWIESLRALGNGRHADRHRRAEAARVEDDYARYRDAADGHGRRARRQARVRVDRAQQDGSRAEHVNRHRRRFGRGRRAALGHRDSRRTARRSTRPTARGTTCRSSIWRRCRCASAFRSARVRGGSPSSRATERAGTIGRVLDRPSRSDYAFKLKLRLNLI